MVELCGPGVFRFHFKPLFPMHGVFDPAEPPAATSTWQEHLPGETPGPGMLEE